VLRRRTWQASQVDICAQLQRGVMSNRILKPANLTELLFFNNPTERLSLVPDTTNCRSSKTSPRDSLAQRLFGSQKSQDFEIFRRIIPRIRPKKRSATTTPIGEGFGTSPRRRSLVHGFADDPLLLRLGGRTETDARGHGNRCSMEGLRGSSVSISSIPALWRQPWVGTFRAHLLTTVDAASSPLWLDLIFVL